MGTHPLGEGIDWGFLEPLPEQPKPTADERRHSEMLAELRLLREAADATPAEVATDAGRATVMVPRLDPGQLSRAIAGAVADVVGPLLERMVPGPDAAQPMAEVAEQLRRMNKKVTNMSVMPSGGSSGHVIVDSGNLALSQPVDVSDRVAREVGRVTVTNPFVPPELDEFTVLAAGTRTVTFIGEAFTNARHKGLALYLDVTAASGTLSPSLDVKVQTQDALSLGWVDMANMAFPQVTAPGLWVLTVYPGVNQSVVGATSRVSATLGRRWRLVHTIGGNAPSFTYSVGGVYLP